jgi:hypothetical protein
MNNIKKRQKKKLLRIRNSQVKQVLVLDNTSKTLNSFLAAKTPRSILLDNALSRTCTLMALSIFNIESLRLPALEIINQKKTTLNLSLRIKCTPTGAEKTVTGATCQEKILDQEITTTKSVLQIDMSIT